MREPKTNPELLAGLASLAGAAVREEEERAAAEEREWERLLGSDYVVAHDAERLRRLASELARRRLEGLRLYEPLPEQERFHKSAARIRILRGSNRGGKTLPAAVEVARAVTGTDPHGKYPLADGRFFCVGKDLAHIGEVMWRKLGHAGAFKMIRDEATTIWRAFRPWDPYDAAYKEKAKDAPPLVPPRHVKKIAWESKGEGIPSKVVLHNGWEMAFYSSLGKPPNGVDLDGWWFDEEIVDGAWFPEMRARLLDRNGRGLWSATPQAGTDALYDLHERAEEEDARGEPRRKVQEFLIRLAENKHIGEEEKKDLAADLTDEERRVRVEGDFAITSYRVYPTYARSVHAVETFPIPADWTRYMVVDPGHQVCAVLFAAVPPPTVGDFIYLYDELYIRECDAPTFGEKVRQKVQGQQFHAFLMDMHFALHTEAGAGKNVLEQYTTALTRSKVSSAATGHSFRLASDDIEAGVTAVRTWLAIRPDGTPKLRVLWEHLKWWEWEIRRYHNQRVQGQVIDKPNQRRACHLMDATRYLAMYDPKWVKPRETPAVVGGALAAYRAKRERRQEEDGPRAIRLGPPGTNTYKGGNR